MEREELLVETLVTLADTLVDTYDLIDFMQTLAERCVERRASWVVPVAGLCHG